MSVPNTSQYTTNMSAIRPSVSFVGMSRMQAQEKLSQVPKNIFNPLTDQRADITGMPLPDMRSRYATNNRNFQLASRTAQPSKRHNITKEIVSLDRITGQEKEMYEIVSRRTKPSNSLVEDNQSKKLLTSPAERRAEIAIAK